ncbi:MAG: FtsX-like permease family protein, partial [Pedobacter sp.]
NIPAISASTRIMGSWFGDALIKTDKKSIYAADFLQADSNFFKVFQYPVLYGNTERFQTLKTVVLSRAYSSLLFGKDVNPVGESIEINSVNGYVVAAVIDTDRYPAHLKFNVIERIEGSGSEDFYSNNYYTYVKLVAGAKIKETEILVNQVRRKALEAFMPRMADELKAAFALRIANNSIQLQEVAGLHLNSTQIEYEFANNGVGKYRYMMLLIATLVLIIAIVNFANLSITAALRRAKEIGIRKTMGAGKLQVGLQFLMETTLLCISSLIVALILVELLLPSFNRAIETNVSLNLVTNVAQFPVQLLMVLLTIICLAGIYPVMLVSNIVPSAVLKGNFSNSNKGYIIRNTLVLIQFSISILFICGIWVINTQLTFMQQKDLGYQPEQVVAINTVQIDDQHFNVVKNKLSRIPGVQLVSRTDHLPGEEMGGNNYVYDGRTYSASFLTVDADYFKAMGMKLMKGRPFDANNSLDATSSLVLTETAANYFNIKDPVGKQIKLFGQDFSIIGLVGDFNHYSPARSYEPI